ncbi:MAG TPA: hypothetical protein DCM10_18265, partial [Xanthomarina gelatinilytica]|nr:hypothetical protein [Xanthomarina gelatinilytica]
CGIRFIPRNPETFETIPIEEPPTGGFASTLFFSEDVNYEVIAWGVDENGGFSTARGQDFKNIFANTKDMRFTYAGCHPNYCDQDIK